MTKKRATTYGAGGFGSVYHTKTTTSKPVIEKQININFAVQEALRDVYDIPVHESLGTLMGAAEGVIADFDVEQLLRDNEPTVYSETYVALKKPYGLISIDGVKFAISWNATASLKLVQDETIRITRDVRHIPVFKITVNVDFERKSRVFRDKEIGDIIAESVLLNAKTD